MRIAILANTLPAALPIYKEVAREAGTEVFVVLCPAPGESPANDLVRHAARFALKCGRWRSLRVMLARRLLILDQPLEHPRSTHRLAKYSFDIGLHKSGNIYRAATIQSFRLGILNAHIGLLPAYRGRSVMEWSILLGDPVGISVFFVDSGIDTGQQIVFTEQVHVSRCQSLAEAKKYLFNLDARFYRRAVALLSSKQVTYQRNDLSGRRYYVMSALFNEAAEEIFSLGKK
ncbi:MAG: formyltransferase family protein [Pyrinomonadaceae bacterium]